MTTPRLVRLSLVAAGLAFAAPTFASTAVPLCGDHGKDDKDAKQTDKNKSESKEPKKDEKKPTNPA